VRCWREKLVWEASKRCVRDRRRGQAGGAPWQVPLPIEVVAFGHESTALKICDALAECDLGRGATAAHP